MNDLKKELVDGVAVLTLEMDGAANIINGDFGRALHDGLQWALGQDGVKGIVLASGHKDFCAGADLDSLHAETDAAALLKRVRDLQDLFRAFETCGKPVAVALTGSALGGGYELALAAHHRVAWNSPTVQVGLPEVTLGVIPGAGGTQRLPRMIGIQAALEMILAGQMVRMPKAHKKGLVDALVDDREAVVDAACAWVRSDFARATQPWDERGFTWPGGVAPGTPDARNLILGAAAMLKKKTAGAYAAPEIALMAVQEGAGLSLDAALVVEARLFVRAALGAQAKDQMRTVWFHRRAAEKHEGLPAAADPRIDKVAILGAGMMGAGLGFLTAKAGHSVVLKDISKDALAAARAHCEKQVAATKNLDDAGRSALLERITYTDEDAVIEGADLVIEAVIEDIDIKHQVTSAIAPLLSDDAIWASNTSALPITELAQPFEHPERFIGLHFFSPVERMPLLEIIMGDNTSEETLARSLAVTKALKKTPIVVNDGYGFFTSRTFSAYVLEGAQLVAEGYPPSMIEHAARRAGMMVAPLQVSDEVSLSLLVKAMGQAVRYVDAERIAGVDLIHTLVQEHQRQGRASGAGYYEYRNGKRAGFWRGLTDLVANASPDEATLDRLGQRLLLVQAAEAARALDAGVLRAARDGDVGAILGLGFAPQTGGPFSYLDRLGISEAVALMQEMAQRYGARYAPAPCLEEMARDGRRFYD